MKTKLCIKLNKIPILIFIAIIILIIISFYTYFNENYSYTKTYYEIQEKCPNQKLEICSEFSTKKS